MSDFPALMQDLKKKGILNYDDVLIKTKAGQFIDTDMYMVDKANLAQCNIRDVTQRKKAESDFEFINKPVTSKDLLKKVREILDR